MTIRTLIGRTGSATTRTIAAVVVVLLHGVAAHAQETLANAVRFLVTNQSVQTGDFDRDRQAAETAHETIAHALLLDLAAAPIGTSSGGFLYRLNPELGTVERASENFGTFFVERALLAGAGHVSFGLTGSTVGYDRLNGLALRDGSFVTVANHVRGETAPFDTESLTMRLRTETVRVFVNMGVLDELELGFVLPLARITLEGERTNVYRGTPFVQATTTGAASGVGDLALRAKYSLFNSLTTSLAAAGELRLPTGDAENLLGAGSTSVRLLGVASFESGPVGVHANGGVVRGGIANEIVLAGALALALHPRATFTTELLRRHVSGIGAFEMTSAAHPSVSGVDTLRLTTRPGGSTLVTAATGIKWNVTDALVLGGHLVWALSDTGLTAPVTPTIGLEYSMR